MKQFSRLFISTLAIIGVTAASAGTIDPDQETKWYNHYKKQPNVPKPAEMLVNTDAEPDLTKGFTDLFNGKDLKGWTPKGGSCTFEAKDGCIVGTVVPKSPSTYLSTDKADYDDFLFTCEMKWLVDGNTGVMFRAVGEKGENGKITVKGPQAEMEGFAKERGWSGGIYGQSCGGWWYPLWLNEHDKARTVLKKNDWNRITLQAKGKVVKTWINGVPAAHWTNDHYLKGFFGLQVHAGAKGKILWRGIKVKEL